MDISFFLAKILGLYTLILGLIVLKKPELRNMARELSRDHGLRFLAGLFTLILGIVLVVLHNVWTGGWRILITLIAWITLLKGFAAIWVDEGTYKKWVEKFSTKSMITAAGVVTLIIGFYLSYVGFFI